MANQQTQHADVVSPLRTGLAGSFRSSSLAPTFLSRLSRLLRLANEWEGRVSEEDRRNKLIRKSIYSSYCDCLAVGLGNEAQQLVERYRARRRASNWGIQGT